MDSEPAVASDSFGPVDTTIAIDSLEDAGALPPALPELREDQIASAVSFLAHEKVRYAAPHAPRTYEIPCCTRLSCGALQALWAVLATSLTLHAHARGRTHGAGARQPRGVQALLPRAKRAHQTGD